MTPEELLIKRYLVIAAYPGNHRKVSSVIFEDDGKQSYDAPNQFDKYPHLFRPLEWYEYRDEKDMPEYLKDNTAIPAIIRKVDYHFTMHYPNHEETMPEKSRFISENRTYPYCARLPATLSEYNEYIKQKNIK